MQLDTGVSFLLMDDAASFDIFFLFSKLRSLQLFGLLHVNRPV
jgi:hypothetical protein